MAEPAERKMLHDLLREHAAYIRNFAAKMLCMYGQIDLLDDLLQDVHVHACRAYKKDIRGFKTWVCQIVKHLIIDEHRRRRVRQRHRDNVMNAGAEQGATTVMPSERLLDTERKLVLAKGLTVLTELQQRVVHLRCNEELPFTEIGLALGIPASTAKTQLCRAKALLRDYIDASC